MQVHKVYILSIPTQSYIITYFLIFPPQGYLLTVLVTPGLPGVCFGLPVDFFFEFVAIIFDFNYFMIFHL